MFMRIDHRLRHEECIRARMNNSLEICIDNDHTCDAEIRRRGNVDILELGCIFIRGILLAPVGAGLAHG